MNRISKILVGGKLHISQLERTIQLSAESGKNAVNVICGKNRTGKTHILRNAYRAVLKFNNLVSTNKGEYEFADQDDVKIYALNKNEAFGHSLFFGEINNILSLPRNISVRSDANFTRNTPKDEKRILHVLRGALEKFCYNQIKSIFKREGINSGKVEWNTDDERLRTIGLLNSNNIYQLDQEDEIVKMFQGITNGKLYLGLNVKTKDDLVLGLHLSHDGKDSFSYGRWSEGQKVFFISILLIQYYQPEILFFDEVENHLHPEYMSQLLSYFKMHVPQTIITTHHPHIVFSKYIDSICYLEVEPNKDEFDSVLAKSDKNLIKPVVRKILKLEKNYAKLLSVYKLFDSYDDQLIRLSSSVLSDLDELLAEAFTNLYTYDILPAAKKKFDLQSEKIFNLLMEKKQKDRITNILDFGAGKGRVLLNLNQIDSAPISRDFQWTLYEPIDKVREELKQNIKDHSLEHLVNVVSTINLDQKFDLVIMANLLHELPPNIIAEIFSRIPKVVSDTGEVIIVELYPLMRPEKFSLPLKSEEWLTLFRRLKWAGVKDSNVFRYADFEASWVQLNKTDDTKTDTTEILGVIEKFWNEILDNRSQDYAGRKSLGAIENSMKVMCELTCIASIVSYFNGEWKMKVI